MYSVNRLFKMMFVIAVNDEKQKSGYNAVALRLLKQRMKEKVSKNGSANKVQYST
jgi:hypothetical protein